MAMTFASGAMPPVVAVRTPYRPAAMPATCVPCQHPRLESGHGTPAPAPIKDELPPGQYEVLLPAGCEKHASATTLPEKNGWVLSTPVSRIATVCPAPR